MKICLTTFFLFVASMVWGQYPGNFSYEYGPVKMPAHNTAKAGNQLIINYDMADELLYGVPSYSRQLRYIHAKYDTSSAERLVYAAWGMPVLTRNDNAYTIPYGGADDMVLDSVSISLAHVNHSGVNDTIFIDLVELDTSFFPSGALLGRDTIITNAGLSPGNTLSAITSVSWVTSQALTTIPVGLIIRYNGALQDTFGLVAGYGRFPVPNGNICFSIGKDKARLSHFYPNSYAYLSNYQMLIPTQAGGDIFFDCNANVIKDTSDSENYIQNWAITAYVSAPEIGIENETAPHLTIYPNPAGNIVNIKGVDMVDKVVVYNAAGLCVQTILQKNTFSLEAGSGIYILEIHYENHVVYKKLIHH